MFKAFARFVKAFFNGLAEFGEAFEAAGGEVKASMLGLSAELAEERAQALADLTKKSTLKGTKS